MVCLKVEMNKMKDLGFRFKTAKNMLRQLSLEFDVETPKLRIKPMKKLHGFYTLNTITINTDSLHTNLAETLRTVRHEFYHYLEDVLCLPERKSEMKAKRFEKNKLSLGLLPKNQTKLNTLLESG